MKKLLLLVNTALFSFFGFSQVTFYVNTPSLNSGDYTNTYGSNATWGAGDLNDPANSVSGELVLAIDSLGCDDNPITNAAQIDGKIAVIYRGGCSFYQKAFNAQTANAIAVVVVNHTGDPVGMGVGGGDDGMLITIPIIMISEQNGALLHDEIVGGGLTCFIGNKQGLYPNDIGFGDQDVLRAKAFSNVQAFSQNDTEFSVETGALLWNYGSLDQTNVTLNCKIILDGNTIYDETSPVGTIPSGDSLFVGFTPFSQTSYANGYYKMTYTVDLGITDEFIDDNVVEADFMMQDNMFTLSRADETTGMPISNTGYFAGTANLFSACVHFSDPNASRKGVSGLTFSATTSVVNDGVHLDDKLLTVEAYKWNAAVTDINDQAFETVTVSNSAVAILLEADLDNVSGGSGEYSFDSDLQNQMVSANFEEPFLLEDGQHYLFCITSEDNEIMIGADNKVGYYSNFANEASSGSPTTNGGNIISPIYRDTYTNGDNWRALGYGTSFIASIGVNLFDSAELGVEENTTEAITAYPNPAKDMLTIPFKNKEGQATVNVVDVTGKTVLIQSVNLTGINTLKLDVTSIEAGMYMFNIAYENGTTSTINVVISK